MKRKSESSPRWRVLRIVGNRAREICELEAANAEAAIKRAIREFEITDPHQQARLAALFLLSVKKKVQLETTSRRCKVLADHTGRGQDKPRP